MFLINSYCLYVIKASCDKMKYDTYVTVQLKEKEKADNKGLLFTHCSVNICKNYIIIRTL